MTNAFKVGEEEGEECGFFKRFVMMIKKISISQSLLLFTVDFSEEGWLDRCVSSDLLLADESAS